MMNEHPPVTEDTEACLALIRELVSSYLYRPGDLWLDAQETEEGVKFLFRVNAYDMKLMIGPQRGLHLSALELVVKQMGKARDVAHSIRLFEPDFGEPAGSYPNENARAHDTTSAAKLLKTLAEATTDDQIEVVTSAVSAPGEMPLSFSFQIYPRTTDGYEKLTRLPEDARNGLWLETALATLFHIAARKSGVRYSVSAIRP